MKKFFTLFALMLILVIAACGQASNDTDDQPDGETSASKTDKTETASENDGKEVKQALLTNYLNVLKTIRPYQGEINKYVEASNNQEADTSAVKASKENAIKAAEEAVTAIDSLTIEGLDKERTTKFNESLSDSKAAYNEYSTALAADKVEVTAAEDKITAANDKLTPLFKEAGLHAPNLAKELY